MTGSSGNKGTREGISQAFSQVRTHLSVLTSVTSAANGYKPSKSFASSSLSGLLVGEGTRCENVITKLNHCVQHEQASWECARYSASVLVCQDILTSWRLDDVRKKLSV